MSPRYTSTGQPWHVQPMPDRNRTRNNGARFQKPTLWARIRALADDRRDAGSLSLLAGLSLVAGCLAALIGFVLFLGVM